MLKPINIHIRDIRTQRLLASSGVYDPTLVNKKIDVMIEELGKLSPDSNITDNIKIDTDMDALAA